MFQPKKKRIAENIALDTKEVFWRESLFHSQQIYR